MWPGRRWAAFGVLLVLLASGGVATGMLLADDEPRREVDPVQLRGGDRPATPADATDDEDDDFDTAEPQLQRFDDEDDAREDARQRAEDRREDARDRAEDRREAAEDARERAAEARGDDDDDDD